MYFVAGSMRSGTTAVGQALSDLHDAVFLGEVRTTLRFAAEPDACDCSKDIAECPVWGTPTSDPESASRAARMMSLESLPRLSLSYVLGLRQHRCGRPLASLVANLRPRTFVDTSKVPSGALAWKVLGEPVHVIHCVRNPWAVARSQADSSTSPTGTKVSRARSVLLWLVYNTMTALLAPLYDSYTLVRFRTLQRHPARVAAKLASIHERREAVGTTFHVTASHAVHANPRRATDEIVLGQFNE